MIGEQIIIDLENVDVARGEQLALHDVRMQVRSGEHLAILGPNGCGKSTLLKALTCELYPIVRQGTRVSLFGRARWDVTMLRRRMGVVSADQPTEASRAISGFEAILTGFFSSSKIWPNLHVTAAMCLRAEEVLHQIGAEPLRKRLVGEMSAGQQRKIMIGRALAGSEEGSMLLLDEPSNALDLAAQHDLRELLESLARGGTSVLMITHHVSDILPSMQRVIMMKEGRVFQDGTRQNLLTEAMLSRLFDRDIQLMIRDEIYFAW